MVFLEEFWALRQVQLVLRMAEAAGIVCGDTNGTTQCCDSGQLQLNVLKGYRTAAVVHAPPPSQLLIDRLGFHRMLDFDSTIISEFAYSCPLRGVGRSEN